MKLFALSCMLQKVEVQSLCTKSTFKNTLGYRRAVSQDEAVGSFVMAVQKDFPDFQMGEVVTLEIPAE